MDGPLIGVIGAGTCSSEVAELAREVGQEIAGRGGVLLCGGLGGVMAAAARGAKEAGGTTVGILPGPSIQDANPYIDIPVATNMGQARNAILVQTAQALVAVAGGYGTLSEMALALKIRKAVVALRPQFDIVGVQRVDTARDAVAMVLQLLDTK
jgi:uncharacterized protein (TIGR00725 family)